MTAEVLPPRQEHRKDNPKRRSARHRAMLKAGWILGTPGVALLTVFIFTPFLSGIPLAFQRWDGFSDPTWIGLSNFQRLFNDPNFATAFKNNIQFLVIATIAKNVIGLSLALLLNRVKRLQGFFRTALFIPVTLSFVAVGLLWTWIYNPSFGLLNQGLEFLGLENLTRIWLGESGTALNSVIAVEVWKWIGFHMVLYLAALQTVPEEQLEAATLDGANAWQRFIHVTIPSISGVIALNLLLAFSGSFLANFDVVWVTTQGGPNYASEVLMTYMISQGFGSGNMGYAAAIGYALFLVVATTAGVAVAVRRFRRLR